MISAGDRDIVEALIAECRDRVARGGRGDRLVKDEKAARALRQIMEECDRLAGECNRMASDLEYLNDRLDRLDAMESDDG